MRNFGVYILFFFPSVIKYGKGVQRIGENGIIDDTGVTGGTTHELHKLSCFDWFFKYISDTEVLSMGTKSFGVLKLETDIIYRWEKDRCKGLGVPFSLTFRR